MLYLVGYIKWRLTNKITSNLTAPLPRTLIARIRNLGGHCVLITSGMIRFFLQHLVRLKKKKEVTADGRLVRKLAVLAALLWGIKFL